ncbi:MAG: hypothetical protein JWO38_706 [Gemmataceae bacterium]|nr:hypothetical protein [Gemmataceae bacterium]
MYQLIPAYRHRFRAVLLAMAACSLVVAAGCSRSAESLVPVEGQVLVNGKPATGAIVTFHPVGAPNNAPRPSGHVDANGTFRLTTREADDGAAPGDYRVTVAWYLASAPRRNVPADEVLPLPQLPPVYTQPTNTPLTATIKPGQTEPLTFDIKKK